VTRGTCIRSPGHRALNGLDAREIARRKGGKGDGEVMSLLEPGQAAEIGQAFAFLFGHVVAVGQVRPGDALATEQLPRYAL